MGFLCLRARDAGSGESGGGVRAEAAGSQADGGGAPGEGLEGDGCRTEMFTMVMNVFMSMLWGGTLIGAHSKLDMVVGTDAVVEESHTSKLPYLCAVMKEILRLHLALLLLVPHCPSEPTTVAGYAVPKDSRIFVNVWAIHRDKSVWEDPLEFKPERFLGEEKKRRWDFSGNDFDYFPFGSGRRICAGIAMADKTFMWSLATLVHSFDWGMRDGEEGIDFEEKFGIVLKKARPLVAVPTFKLARPELYE
ncbi:Cytochrome P450 76C2 [Acorus gramineus]|uniref:Cytochrome P450 76C2 n=1 Tax=Acorus gramineus TaxID=55184 RepID=A0AAV9AF35_ACOGR|nr:Cytochrome P450 76C2 [Acorus gramineus]